MKKNENSESMKITESAFFDMINYIGSKPAESGGAGFGYESDNVIRDFVPDINAKATRSSYTMNTPFLNQKIKEKWEKEQKSLLLIGHAHPYGSPYLSGPDREYFEDLLNYMSRDKFYAPILFTIPDGGLKIFPYLYEKNSTTPKRVRLEIVPDDYKEIKTDSNNKKEVPKQSERTSNSSESVQNNYLIFTNKQSKKTVISDKASFLLSVVISALVIYSVVFFSTFFVTKFLTEFIVKFIAL